MSDSPELLKPSAGVTDNELQIEVGNLRIENETLKAEYAKLLESSTHITNKLKTEVQEVRSQLRTETADREELETELSDLREKSLVAVTKDLPEAATILSQLRGKRKKSKADLADIEAVLEILEN